MSESDPKLESDSKSESDLSSGSSGRPAREPIFSMPAIVVVSCAVLLAIHGIRELVSVETDNTIIALFALVPARFTIALHFMPDQVSAAFHAAVDRDPVAAAQIQFLLGDGHARWWTLLTYGFLHASWAHVGFNCIWLVAFGSAVARRFSAWRFVLLLAISAIAGALVQYAFGPTSFEIVLGASAAVAGAMGAAARFVFRPSDEPRRVFDRSRLEDAYRQRALTLRQTVTTPAALIFVVFWFATNLLFGLVPSLGGIGSGPVAWQAHIGGFLAGLLLFSVFDPPRPAPRELEQEDSAALGAPEDASSSP